MENLRFSGNRDQFGDALGLGWEGPVPFTALVSPGGDIVYRHHGPFDPLTLRTVIVENLGRTYF
jgi:hypothetical protein